MIRVRALKAHSKAVGVGVFKRGDVYNEFPLAAEQKAALGLVELVSPVLRNKADPVLYVEPKLTFVRSGSWFVFSDGEKVLGKRAAALKLGVDLDELEVLDVDFDDG
jgi:hypothetical protein